MTILGHRLHHAGAVLGLGRIVVLAVVVSRVARVEIVYMRMRVLDGKCG